MMDVSWIELLMTFLVVAFLLIWISYSLHSQEWVVSSFEKEENRIDILFHIVRK